MNLPPAYSLVTTTVARLVWTRDWGKEGEDASSDAFGNRFAFTRGGIAAVVSVSAAVAAANDELELNVCVFVFK